MPYMPKDVDAKPIPCLRPVAVQNVTSTTSAAVTTDVTRLVSSTGGTYTVGAATAVSLPADLVEYIRTVPGETITVSGTFNITDMG